PSGVVVVDVRARRQLAEPRAKALVGEEPPDDRVQAGMDDLAAQELREAVQLVGGAAQARGQCGGVFLSGLERANVELQAVSVLVDPPEHAHGVTLAEAAVQQLDIAPDAGLDPTAGV